ncbi:uncharacterized protein [Nicotiana tomentosiformis]|uniref:uncharacterized protein isoform X1 n=1 Tax=Nicotiana tomentosiformis TaxID=4098 RepID=UPI00051BD95A|nr:uncharacterized protein LOC104112186 isoform X1 [Nicotiana tomentosiformis]XP_009620332.1 uncharacterized protein LOC104112186 isoform X1 [Nicotiana tomentosiformis]XP_033516150.1 uncharacterized protein LOC104112186 isoform X1 [Nicotiana tomentosiformis]
MQALVAVKLSFNQNEMCKQGVPWTEEEHMMFLLGLQKLGKDDINGCIMLAKSGLAHHDNYHEFCRLLGCFKVNYQAGILVFRSRKWARVVGLQTQSRDLSQLLRKGFDWMKLMRPLNEEKDHWVPDEAVRKCTACGTDFGAFVRRVSIYSNRFCLYCVDSPNNVVLPYGVFLKHSWIISYPLKPFFTL